MRGWDQRTINDEGPGSVTVKDERLGSVKYKGLDAEISEL
jgi:hypothetical protein